LHPDKFAPTNVEEKRKIKRNQALFLYNKISPKPEICGGKKNWDDSTINSIINRKCRGLNPDHNI